MPIQLHNPAIHIGSTFATGMTSFVRCIEFNFYALLLQVITEYYIVLRVVLNVDVSQYYSSYSTIQKD